MIKTVCLCLKKLAECCSLHSFFVSCFRSQVLTAADNFSVFSKDVKLGVGPTEASFEEPESESS